MPRIGVDMVSLQSITSVILATSNHSIILDGLSDYAAMAIDWGKDVCQALYCKYYLE